MFKPENLHWSDIESDLFEGIEYIEHIKSKRDKIRNKSNYKAYRPDPKIIPQIQEILENSDKELKILTLGASWCKTCSMVKPLLIKIVEEIETPKLSVHLLGGVKTTMGSSHEDYQWAKKSPPEFHSKKFSIEEIPTIFFFDGQGNCITRVVKYPEHEINYEKKILKILEKI